MSPTERAHYEQIIREAITVPRQNGKKGHAGKLHDYDVSRWESFFPSIAYVPNPQQEGLARKVLLEALSKMSLIEIAQFIESMHAYCVEVTNPGSSDR